MSTRRVIAWAIFLGCLALVGLAGALGMGPREVRYADRAVQLLFLGFWLVWIAAFVWAYAHTRSPADRQRLIDGRGINLLPRPLRRWLFDS